MKPHVKKALARANSKRLLGKFGQGMPAFKGESVHFNTKHSWIRRNFPISKNCKCCGVICKTELANIDGNYTREISNYIYLCRVCHRRWDMGLIALNINGRIWKREFIGKRLLKNRKIASKRIDDYGHIRYVAKANYDHERIEKSFKIKADAEKWYKIQVLEFSNRKVPVICVQN